MARGRGALATMEDSHSQSETPPTDADNASDREDQELMNILAGTDVDKLLAEQETSDREPLPVIDDHTLVEVVDGPPPAAGGEPDELPHPAETGSANEPADPGPDVTQDDLDELLRQAGAVAERQDEPGVAAQQAAPESPPVDRKDAQEPAGPPTATAGGVEPPPAAATGNDAGPPEGGAAETSINQLDEMLADRAGDGEAQADAASDVPAPAGPPFAPTSDQTAKTAGDQTAAPVQGVTPQETAAIASEQSPPAQGPDSEAQGSVTDPASPARPFLTPGVKSVLAYAAFALLVASLLLLLKTLLMPATV